MVFNGLGGLGVNGLGCLAGFCGDFFSRSFLVGNGFILFIPRTAFLSAN